MQEINLLQNKLKDKTNQLEMNNRVVMTASVILLLVVGVAGFAIQMMANGAVEKKAQVDQENISIQRELDRMDDQLKEARGFQAQSKNLAILLENHVIWTDLITELAQSAFVNSQVTGMTSDTSGRIVLMGITISYTDLGKVLLALNTSEAVESVKLVSTSRADGEQSGVQYSLDVQAKTSILSGIK